MGEESLWGSNGKNAKNVKNAIKVAKMLLECLFCKNVCFAVFVYMFLLFTASIAV